TLSKSWRKIMVASAAGRRPIFYHDLMDWSGFPRSRAFARRAPRARSRVFPSQRDRSSKTRSVIPALVAGIQPSANGEASGELDPGHEARDDKREGRRGAGRPRLLPSLRGVLQQRLARLDDRELYRRIGDLELGPTLASDGELRGRKVAFAGEIRAEVGSAAVLALERRAGDHLRDLDERAQVEPVVPGEVEGALAVRHARCEQLGLDRVELDEPALQPGLVADHAHVVPHAIEQRLAQAVEVASLAREGVLRSLELCRQDILVRRPMARVAADPFRHGVAGDGAEHGRVGNAV